MTFDVKSTDDFVGYVAKTLLSYEMLMVERGYPKSSIRFQVATGNKPITLHIWYRNEFDKRPYAGSETMQWIHHITVSDWITAITELIAFIAGLPTSADLLQKQFTESVAKSIELGKLANVDLEVLNPLTEMMKKLSENALTFTLKPARIADIDNSDDDGIPF